MHRIALRNSARKAALAAVPRVMPLPPVRKTHPIDTLFHPQATPTVTRAYATAKPGQYTLVAFFSCPLHALQLPPRSPLSLNPASPVPPWAVMSRRQVASSVRHSHLRLFSVILSSLSSSGKDRARSAAVLCRIPEEVEDFIR